MRSKTSAILLVVILFSQLIACSESFDQLHSIKQRGFIKVLTRLGPTSSATRHVHEYAFEQYLARQFADYLGVEAKFSILHLVDIESKLLDSEADFAAANLVRNQIPGLRYSRVYQTVSPVLVSSRDEHGRVAFKQNDNTGKIFLSKGFKPLTTKWDKRLVVDTKRDSEELLQAVASGLHAGTLTTSNELALLQNILPQLIEVPDLDNTELHLAWAFKDTTDDSLFEQAESFFKSLEENGELERIIEQYYGHTHEANYWDNLAYIERIETRLPEFKIMFQQAANEYGLDWRLLAAIAYQESHWYADASSYTGVRGLMMLTKITAEEMGVTDRLDPKQSIQGGSAYFNKLKAKLPFRIKEPDRTWFALAAYNVGYGHLEDARVLTQRSGQNPDHWYRVKNYLPRLRLKKWYQKTRYGFARGEEPVRFVENIRRYYDTLVWLDNEKEDLRKIKRRLNQITIDSPTL